MMAIDDKDEQKIREKRMVTRQHPLSGAARKFLVAAYIALLSPLVHGQGDDDFLTEIEGTMDGIEAPEPAPTIPDSSPNLNDPLQDEFLDQIGTEIEGMNSPGGGKLIPEDARAQFDADLQDRMPGSFVLYKRLSEPKRDQVFDEYQMSGDYLRVRRKIIELRRSSN